MEYSSSEIICPFNTEWKFQKIDLMELKDSKNGFCKGKCFYAFNIPGLQYYIEIYPNGDVKDCLGEVWVFLQIICPDGRKITCESTLFIESTNFSSSLNYIYQYDGGYGLMLCKADKFFDSKRKYFIDGEMNIKVKGKFKCERSLNSMILQPISMQWKITEKDLKAKMEDKDFIRSKTIKIPKFSSEARYSICIFPNELDEEDQSKVGLYLEVGLDDYEETIEAFFDFSVDSVNFNHNFEHIFEEEFSDEGTYLCSTEDFFNPSKRYIVNGIFTINLNGILMKENNNLMVLKCFGLISKASEKKREKDFTIFVGDKEIKVHKQVLKDASLAFTGMLQSGMKESIENKMIIKDFSFNTVEIAIKLFYNINILRKFTIEDLLLLYQFAEKYEIKCIMNRVEFHLIKQLSPANVCQLYKFSQDFRITKLNQRCINYLIQCSKKSIAVYALDSIEKETLGTIFLNTCRFDVNS